MSYTGVICYLFAFFLWNIEVIYSTLCRGINGTYCCSGYRWSKIQNNCIPCTSGYTGINCDTKCIYPLFGQDCQSVCNCTEEHCDHIYGCRNSSGKTIENICKGKNGINCCQGYMWNREKTKCIACEIGYFGMDCDVTCPFPSYGHECQLRCTCEETDCDFVNGCRRSLNVSSLAYNSTSVDVTATSFNGNITNIKDSFRTALDVDDNNATNKMCDSALTKGNDSDGFRNALIGLAIVASLITFIYLYTYLLEKHRTRPLTVNVSV
ncbi:multiple epidermal growth factor-like domains protein 10 [Magallana gigas]|uniref:multiple epidermal growth factor-like domains protein 10 n=1 Tax=Magallana gigas TaxID=29159 RepID=UPI00148A3F10|nr:multiple epidermal growth factor-like domains protein 10 isoform X1 [Crassostrea gigas]